LFEQIKPDVFNKSKISLRGEKKWQKKKRNRQFNPIFTRSAGRVMMSSKDKEARSWSSYREPNSWSKSAAIGNSRLSSGNRPV
jgi:hypothetical protein